MKEKIADYILSYKKISPQEAKERMSQTKEIRILDVRTKEEFDAGHIKGAICIPNETIGEDEIAELPDKNQQILVYCRSGIRSRQAALKLVRKGYTDIKDLGGILDWNYEIEKAVSCEKQKIVVLRLNQLKEKLCSVSLSLFLQKTLLGKRIGKASFAMRKFCL